MSNGDPAVKCDFCNGTGRRKGITINLIRSHTPQYKCNGCRGTGVKYYPDWPEDYVATIKNTFKVRNGIYHALAVAEKK